MEFDDSTNRPTFTLRYGTPGTSYAFEIARECGIEGELVNLAKGYLDRDEVRLNRLIDKLNELKQDAIGEKKEAERVRKKYRAARKRMIRAIEQYQSEKTRFIEEKRNETDRLLKSAQEDFRELINHFKKSGKTTHALAKEKYDDIVNRIADGLRQDDGLDKAMEPEEFRTGQLVRHKGLGQAGRIIAVDRGSSKAQLLTGNIKVSAGLEDLEPIDEMDLPAEDRTSGGPVSHIMGNPVREINLIGLRVEEALSVVDKVIDKTMVEGDLSFMIIHGYGTGRLKRAVREHLKAYPCVKRIRGADARSGGEAITIVELS